MENAIRREERPLGALRWGGNSGGAASPQSQRRHRVVRGSGLHTGQNVTPAVYLAAGTVPGSSVTTVAGGARMLTGGYSHEAVIKRLSLPRFAPYETVTSDRAAALALYEWNADACAVVFHAIGMLEVLLRNSLSDVLGQMFPGPVPWYNQVSWDARTHDDVAKARGRATLWGKLPEVEGSVVAELTFRFWRYLLARKHCQRSPKFAINGQRSSRLT